MQGSGINACIAGNAVAGVLKRHGVDVDAGNDIVVVIMDLVCV